MTQTLEYRRSVRAPAAEAYRAFTRATPLRDWLCDVSLADARVAVALVHRRVRSEAIEVAPLTLSKEDVARYR